MQKILDASPDNYRALVFLGKSAEGLNQSDHALKAYRQAIDVSPDEILAWQGLNKLYEKYPPTQTKDHTEVLEKLVKLTTRYLLPFYASCDSDWFLSTIKMVSNVYHLFYFNCICFFSVDSDDQKKEESIYQLALHLVTCYNYDEKVRFLLY